MNMVTHYDNLHNRIVANRVTAFEKIAQKNLRYIVTKATCIFSIKLK
jgi:hypothetical protein